jgi:outer membrane protein assembly factor BamB
MSANVPFERRLAAWMVDEVGPVPPDDRIDAIVSTTSQLQPEPRWLVLLKESPMRANTQVAVGSPSRRLAVAIALALLILGATIVVGASILRTQAAAGDWPMFRGDAARSGVGLQGPRGLPQLHWRYQLAGLPGNVSIVGDAAYVATDNGTLTAIDLATGNERWSFHTDRGALVGPTVVDGLAYVSDATGTVLAIDAATGKEAWAASASYPNINTATVGAGRVYLGLSDSGLVALDAKTGAERWKTPIHPGSESHTPAFADGVVYVSNDGVGIAAVSAETGQTLWTTALDGDVPGTAVVADGTVYVGLGGGVDKGRLRALSAKTGSLKWQTDDAFQAPAVSGGIAFATDNTGLVAALRASDGSKVWQIRLPAAARAPAVADGIVYLASKDPGHVYALSAATGGKLWDFSVDAAVQCCIAAAHGYAFVPTSAGSVYAIGGDGSTVHPAPPADLITGPTTEPTPAPTAPLATTAPSFAPVASPNGMFAPTGKPWAPQIITTDADGNFWVADPFYDRFGIFSPNGKFKEFWGKAGDGPGQLNMHRSSTDSLGNVGFASDGTMFVLDVGHRRIQVFDKNRKFIKAWGSFGNKPGEFSEAVNLVIGPGGTIYVLDDIRGVIEQYDRDGKVLKTFDAFPNAQSGQGAANSLAIDAAGNLYVSDNNPIQVTRFDPDGNVTGTFGSRGVAPGQFRDGAGFMAIDAQGRLFVDQGPGRGSQPGVLVFDKDGNYLGGFGTLASGDSQVTWPTGLYLTGDEVLVSDVGKEANGSGTEHGPSVHRFTLLPPFAP